jgi:hypothetical protein
MVVLAKRASKEGVNALTRWIKSSGQSVWLPGFFFASANALSQIAFNFPDKLKALTPWAVGKRSCPFFWSWSCLTRSPAQALN